MHHRTRHLLVAVVLMLGLIPLAPLSPVAAKPWQSLTVGDVTMHFSTPVKGKAYDDLVVPFRIEGPLEGEVAVTANAFERPSEAPYYDSYVPGVLTADVEYIGSSTTERLGAPTDHEPVLTSVLEDGFQRHYIQITNSGDTVWKAQGLGGVIVRMQILSADGAVVDEGVENTISLDEDLYPGDVRDFSILQYPLPAGDYEFRFLLAVHTDDAVNVWDPGQSFSWLDVPLSIGEQARGVTKLGVDASFRVGAEDGIHPHPDAPSIETEIGGRMARVSAGESFVTYMTFGIDDEILYDVSDPYYVEVEYFDQGTDSFFVEYDGQPSPWTPTAAVERTDTGTWKTALFLADRPRFTNSASGSDFRITSLQEPVHVSRIEVGRYEIEEAPPVWVGGEELQHQEIRRFPDVLEDFQEFMMHAQVFDPSTASDELDGTLEVQLPPWSTTLTVKLVTEDGIAVYQVPVEVSTKQLRLKTRTASDEWTVQGENGPEPVVSTWYYPYRTARFSEDPEQQIEQDLLDMRAAGINVVWIQLFPHFIAYDNVPTLIALEKARELGLQIIPSLFFHNQRTTLADQVGIPLDPAGPGYAESFVDPMEEGFAPALLEWYERMDEQWGDTFYQTASGRTPVTLGEEVALGIWTRRVGGFTESNIEAFRTWLQDKYGSLESVNAAWGTSYPTFEDIDPQLNFVPPKDYPAEWREDSAALMDLDTFRSFLLFGQFADASTAIKQAHPEVLTGVHIFPAFGMEGTDAENYYGIKPYNWVGARTAALEEHVLDQTFSTLDFVTFIAGGGETDWGGVAENITDSGMVPALYPAFNSERFVTGQGMNETWVGSGGWYELQGVEARDMRALQAVVPNMIDLVENGGIAGLYAWNDHPLYARMTDVQIREVQLFQELAAS